MKLSCEPVRLRLRAPLSTAHGELRERDGFLVRLDEGRGEAAPLPWFGTEDAAACARALADAAAALAEVRAPERLEDVALPRWLDATPAARHAIELALLDDLSLRASVPLRRLLQPRAGDEVPVSALLTAREPAALAREARAAAAGGFATVKLKVAHAPLEDDLARAGVVRDAAGPDVRLRLDANGGWTEASALNALRRLAHLSVELCEQPSAEVDSLRRLRGATPVAIAADESVPRSNGELLDAVDAVVLKPMVLGGLLPALGWARRARARGLRVIVTTSLDGCLGRLGAAQLAAALLAEGPMPDAGLATGRLLETDVCEDPAAPARGRIALPRTPGLGAQ
ncbi:MAG: mandelate racemase/muconate lactonizing enzyme family protein [Myxococcales bacterium]